jgi:polysaccharide biosynthesis protein PelE
MQQPVREPSLSVVVPMSARLPGAVAGVLVALSALGQALGIALSVGPGRNVGTAMMFVLVGATVGSGALLLWVSRGPRLRLADALLVVGFGLFLPALGLVGLGLMLALRARSNFRRRLGGVIETDSPVLPGSPLLTDESARFGPGSLEGILRHSKDAETRLRVVLACRQLPGRLAVPLLRLALRDTVDDVRLLAYAVLESKERRIQNEIQSLLGRADKEGLVSLNTAAHAKLAELHWELVYQGLVEGELLAFSLDKVLSHTAEVMGASNDHPRMAFLAGRALLLRGRAVEARAMFNDSLRRGFPGEVVGPYLAEVAYLERKPDEVRKQIAAVAPTARLRPGLAVIVERWSE